MAKRYKLCVCGHFAFGENKLNGQTIKTKIVTDALVQRLGQHSVMQIDTCGGIKALFRLPFVLTKVLRCCDNLVILPAYKGVRIITLILSFLRFFSRSCKVHYVVIGGWLPKYVREKFLLLTPNQSIDLNPYVLKNINIFDHLKSLRLWSENFGELVSYKL